jgi:hypothetical protein
MPLMDKSSKSGRNQQMLMAELEGMMTLGVGGGAAVLGGSYSW